MADGDGNPRLSIRAGEILQRRAPNAAVIMTARPRQVVGGESITLTWGVTEGSAEFHDWLGLFHESDDKKPLRHCYVKGNKRGGEWVVEAPREAGKYVFRFIKSLFPYDLIHKDYLGLARSNFFEVVQAADANTESAAAAKLDDETQTAAKVGPSAMSHGQSSPQGTWINPPPRSASGHRRSGSGGSSSLLGASHPLAWIVRHFSSDDDLASLKLEDVVSLSFQVEDNVQACIIAKRLAAAAEQPGPGRRAMVDAGGAWALLHLAKWLDPDIQKEAARGLHSLVTFVPTIFGGMHDAGRRLVTFPADWPHSNSQTLSSSSMAQAGFYWQGLEHGSDRVICHACGVILEGWTEGQVPAVVHAHTSPHCRLLQADAQRKPFLPSLPSSRKQTQKGPTPAEAGAAPGLARGADAVNAAQSDAKGLMAESRSKDGKEGQGPATVAVVAADSVSRDAAGDAGSGEQAVSHDDQAQAAAGCDRASMQTEAEEGASDGASALQLEDSSGGVWGSMADEEAGGVGVLEVWGVRRGASGGAMGSVAQQLLVSPHAQQGFTSLSMSTDKQVQLWWYRLLAALAHAAGPSLEFQAICLPRLLLAASTCKDETRLVNILEALRWLALQPACRRYLTKGAGVDTLCLLINALPKWSARNVEVAHRLGAAPSDVWPRLLENAMCVLQHTFSTTNTHHHPALYIPHGAVAAVLCVLREAPECEIQRAAVACLHSLMDAYSPGRDLPVAGETVGDGGGRTGVESASGEVPDGAGSGPSEKRRKASIKEITSGMAVRRLVELMVCGSDLHLRTSVARLLGKLIVQRPSVCLEIVCVGLVGQQSEETSGWIRKDTLNVETVAYPVAALRCETWMDLPLGPELVDGITSLLWLARDTGVGRGQVTGSSSGCSDVMSQRMVAKCIEALALTTHMDPTVMQELMSMGFKEAEAGQALRMVGGASLECAVTFLTARGNEDAPGCHEDEFEMVEDSPLDLPGMFISRGGLDCLADMLQESDLEVQVSLWKAIAALTRVGFRCRVLLRSKVGQEWVLPLVAGWAGGAGMMQGLGDDSSMPVASVAGAGGKARDSLGSCQLEVVANLAADAETCRQLLPHGIVLLLANAGKAARAWDVVGARTCARGLYYTVMNSPLHEGEEQWDSWWPSDPSITGGTQALLHLCWISADTGVQRWTAMSLHRLCLKASQVGWTALLEYIIANRGVQSLMHLVYSRAVEVSTYAMATLALLSSSAAGVILSPAREAVSAKRALFLAGVMFPVNKLGRQAYLDMKIAASRILANLSTDRETLEDMLTGSNDNLELAFHLLALSPADEWQTARRDRRLIVSSACPSPSCTESVIEIKNCVLQWLQAACVVERFQPRFLTLSGMQILYELAQSDECIENKSMARGIVKLLEILASNPTLRQVLHDGGCKDVVKMLFKRHEDGQIETSMENILVELSQPRRLATPSPNPSPNPSLNPSLAVSTNNVSGMQDDSASVGTGWRVSCQRTLASGEQEQWVFSVMGAPRLSDLQQKLSGKFGSSVVITFLDEDDEWKLLSAEDGDAMLQYAMSLPRNLRKKKLHIQVTVIRPMGEQMQGARARQEALDGFGMGPERNPACDEETTPVKELMTSHLCDSSPNFIRRGGSEADEYPTLRWRLGPLIGEGAYAKVFQGINADTGGFMAVKQVSLMGGDEDVKKREEAANALQREIEVMKVLQHDNIVKYLGSEMSDGRLNIFLEYVSGGSIASMISKFGALDEPVVRNYTRQILVGLEFLHDKGIVHCDIKGGNILVTEHGIIKLADFNSSKELGNIAVAGSNPLRSLLGTPQFMAPEVIRQTGHGKKADIWSVGCTVLQMLSGSPPWDKISNKITLMFHIASCKDPPPPPEDISDEAREFLDAAMQIEARDRPACRDLLLLPFCADRD